jgi:predicted metalloprotease with PDZ domain
MGTDKSSWGKSLTMNCQPRGCPQIQGRILDRINVDFWIDTGANATGYLKSRMFRKIITEESPKTSSVFVQTLSGIQRRGEMRLADLSVGPLKYRDLIFTEGSEPRLGLSFLSRHIVTFDFPNSKIYFREGNKFNRTDETDMSGLHLYRISGEVVAYSVDDGSPACKAGIKALDVILKIGDDVNLYDIWEIRELMRSGDGHKIVMTIKRGPDIKEVFFLLKKRI